MPRRTKLALTAAALLGLAAYVAGIAATAQARPVKTPAQVRQLIRSTWRPDGAGATSQALSIAWRESRYRPHAINHSSGAAGIFQFIPSTWNGSWNPWRNQPPTDARANIAAAHRLWKLSGGSFYPHWAATARQLQAASGITATAGSTGPPGLDQAIRAITKQLPPHTTMASTCVAESLAGPWDCTLDLYAPHQSSPATRYHLSVWRLKHCPHGWTRCWKWHWTQLPPALEASR